jgi:hypothetical protein
MKFSDLRIKISVNQDLCQTLSRPSSVPSILMFHTHSLWTIYTTATCRDYLRVHAKVSGHFFYEKIPNYTLDITPLVGQVKSQRVSRGKFHENHQYGEVYQASITIDHHDSPLNFHGFSMVFPCFLVSGIELSSAAIASNAGGHQAATLRVAEQWVAAWKDSAWPGRVRGGGRGSESVGIPMGKNKRGR